MCDRPSGGDVSKNELLSHILASVRYQARASGPGFAVLTRQTSSVLLRSGPDNAVIVTRLPDHEGTIVGTVDELEAFWAEIEP